MPRRCVPRNDGYVVRAVLCTMTVGGLVCCFISFNDRLFAMEKCPAVYILTNKNDTVVYTGVTSNLVHRVSQHKAGIHSGFPKRYGCNKLVYYEQLGAMELAILREKQIKAGARKKKDMLIDALNPKWIDLFYKISE